MKNGSKNKNRVSRSRKFDPLDWISAELHQLEQDHLLRDRREVVPMPNARCVVRGRELVNFSSNDYLDLACDLRVIAAAQRALTEGGVGSRASPFVCGRTVWHAALEKALARFENEPTALLFPSGFSANMGTICALVGKGDLIFSDRLNHASLIDGCRLSNATIQLYDHADLGGLEQSLQTSSSAGRRLIVTDSVFSMDGDLAPLPALCDLAEKYQAMLLVDEAHATGVFGKNGRGIAELFGVEKRVAVRVGTLSKGVGALGGFVAGSKQLVDWLWNRARPQVFSTGLPPAVCAAAAAAIEIIEQEPQRRERLLKLAAALRKQLLGLGIEIPPNSVGPIVPVLLETPERAMQVAQKLERLGYLVGAIRPPTVPAGTSRLRITLSYGHADADLSGLAEALAKCLSITKGSKTST